MGWTYTHRESGLSDRQFFQREFGCDVLDASRKAGVIYLKCCNKKCRPETTFAVVVLFRMDPHDYHNFGYKDIDETMGPFEVRCPLRIIEGLSPTDSENANKWRESVRQWNAKRKYAPKYGQLIRFATPMRFTDGSTHTEFTVERYGKRGKAYRAADGTLVKISRIADRDFEVVSQ